MLLLYASVLLNMIWMLWCDNANNCGNFVTTWHCLPNVPRYWHGFQTQWNLKNQHGPAATWCPSLAILGVDQNQTATCMKGTTTIAENLCLWIKDLDFSRILCVGCHAKPSWRFWTNHWSWATVHFLQCQFQEGKMEGRCKGWVEKPARHQSHRCRWNGVFSIEACVDGGVRWWRSGNFTRYEYDASIAG